jgi:diguanylate cyclase (GGDEF)-like protein
LITREEAEGLREQLLAVLAEDAHNTERLLSRLDVITRETGIGAHAALLLILTRLAFEDGEAKRHWSAILAHREKLARSLTRDVGLRVALLDYFMNVNRQLTRPTLIDLELLEAHERTRPEDVLTGLASDRVFRNAVQSELRRAKRYGQDVAVALFDLDDFGEVNDRVGAIVADRLLRETAIILSNKVRDIDVAARPGEDELALVLPETDRNGALLVSERFRREVETHFTRREIAGRPLELTISGGIAAYPNDATTPEAIVERAAQALYRAKASGKNQVGVYTPERRRYLRFDLEPGRFEIEVLTPKEIGRASARNLSRNGIIFTSPEVLEVGEQIEVRLVDGSDAEENALRVRGTVVRLEQIPEQDQVSGVGLHAHGDRYEIGMAFGLDAGATDRALMEFLERARSTGKGS